MKKTVEFWGGKLDGKVILIGSKDNFCEEDLLMLMENLVKCYAEITGALRYQGENYILREDKEDDEYFYMMYIGDGELYDLLEGIKLESFPDDEGYFF